MKNQFDLDIYLVIGLTKESRHWSADFLQEIKDRLSPKGLHFIELPGAGQFNQVKSPANIGKIVDEARSQLMFHSERKRLVVAISLGGMVAWEWVTRYPNDFHGLVMINSSLAGISPLFKRLRPGALGEFFKIALAPRGEKKEKLVLNLCSNHENNSKKILPYWTELSLEASMSFPNVLNQLFAAMRFRPTKRPVLPMLVIASKHDKLAHYSCSEQIAGLVKAKFILCEDEKVGHAFHVDAPQFLVKQIEDWVGQSFYPSTKEK